MTQTTPMGFDELIREMERRFDGAIWALRINDSDTSELEKSRDRQLAEVRRHQKVVQRLAIVLPYGSLYL